MALRTGDGNNHSAGNIRFEYDFLKHQILEAFGYSLRLSRFTFQHVDMAYVSSLLRMALLTYAESLCCDSGQSGWDTVPSEPIRNNGDATFEPLFLYRRRLACLDSFVGGPIWCFGRDVRASTAWLSISIEQFADVWGPLYVVPASYGFETLLAVRTEGGILIRSSEEQCSPPQHLDETLIHWVAISPSRLQRSGLERPETRLAFRSTLGDSLPQTLQPFSATGRLLIGNPTRSAASSTTITSSTPSSAQNCLSVTVNSLPGFRHNTSCPLTLEDYGRTMSCRLRPAGARQEVYLPEEYQASLGGGQYVNVGVTRIWKKRPARTYKTMILDYFSKPNSRPKAILSILRLTVGLEMSACTQNARRVSLEDVLKLSHPDELQEVEAACTTGDPLAVSLYLASLEHTGFSHEGHALLYWPPSPGIGHVLDLALRPQWLQILRDTDTSACFAVVSPRCLVFAAQDRGRVLKRLCSPTADCSLSQVLQTVIELDPKDKLRPPLNKRDEIHLAAGSLSIRNHDSTVQLAVFEGGRKHHKWFRSAEFAHRELMDTSTGTQYSVSLYICDAPKRWSWNYNHESV